jgi:hypothetical protein
MMLERVGATYLVTAVDLLVAASADDQECSGGDLAGPAAGCAGGDGAGVEATGQVEHGGRRVRWPQIEGSVDGLGEGGQDVTVGVSSRGVACRAGWGVVQV